MACSDSSLSKKTQDGRVAQQCRLNTIAKEKSNNHVTKVNVKTPMLENMYHFKYIIFEFTEFMIFLTLSFSTADNSRRTVTNIPNKKIKTM